MSSPAFTKPEDIGNRALQHCGASRIVTFQDNDKGAAEVSACYDGLRRAELRRNLWTFSVRRAVLYPINTPLTSAPVGGTVQPTMQYVPAQWVSTKLYAFGAIVAHNGNIWVNSGTFSSAQEPGVDGVTNWDTFFGSLCVNPWQNPNTVGLPTQNVASQFAGYFIGDLVYVNGQVFVSLENGNVSAPLDPSVWSSTAVYSKGQVVLDAQGWEWKSNIANNTGFTPGVYGFWSATPTYVVGAYVIGTDNVLYQALASTNNQNPANGAFPAVWKASGFPGSWPQWSPNETYAKNAIVAGTDGFLYQSVINGNVNKQPVGSVYNPNTPATNTWVGLNLQIPWFSNFGSGAGNSAWLGLDGTMDNININYPIGTGPSIQTQNKNVFFLPNGYLRTAPQEPKQGSTSFLGAPTGLMYTDWEFDGKYIISQTPYPIIFRFGADVTQVNQMDDMFCEALSARIASEVCETLTQSNTKLASIGGQYKKFVDEARTVNGIEQGPTEPPEDDYITCRI